MPEQNVKKPADTAVKTRKPNTGSAGRTARANNGGQRRPAGAPKKPLNEQTNPEIAAMLAGTADIADKKPAATPAKPAVPAKPATNTMAATTTRTAVRKKPVDTSATTTEGNAATTKTTPHKNRRRGKKIADKNASVRVIPLGGLGEVGKNITVYECGNDAFLIDCGLTFPDESMPGVDLVIPDFSYLNEIRDRIRGLAITHGHEDHIGAIPFLLRNFDIPIYGTRLALGLIEGKLKEHGLEAKTKLNVVKAGDTVQFGCMACEFINVNHSIPDACALAVHTPSGVIVHTGDFKVDYTPIRGDVINLARFGELGSHGVLALFSESTNVERPGSTASERTVGESLDKLFASADVNRKRIIIATFASNVHRLQQIIDAAAKSKRKVAVSGRSMENVVAKSLELGYIDAPKGVLIEIDQAARMANDKVVIITTGSQGEPMSALTRMAAGDHRKVSVTQNDCIIISATPIPGNEKLVTRVINDLLRLGAQVIYEKMYEIHVSGHACQDELKMMMALVRPKFFMPIHGEYKHLIKHAELAKAMSIPESNILIAENGNVIELNADSIKVATTVTSGKVFVDGLGIGDVGSIVLRDRKHLAEDGLIVVVTTIDKTGKIISGPDIVSRGFVYVRESEDMMAKTREIARACIQKCIENNTREWGTIKQRVRDDVGDYLWHVTKRNPMILPIIQEVYREKAAPTPGA